MTKQPVERPVKRILVTIYDSHGRPHVWGLLNAAKFGNQYVVSQAAYDKLLTKRFNHERK